MILPRGYNRTDMSVPVVPGSTVLLINLTRAIHRRATEDVIGMRLKQYMALSHLRDMGTTPQQDLVGALGLDANNGVLLLNDLEAAGWVERRRDSADRRRHIVDITGSGRRAVERAERALDGVEEDVLGALSPDERETLRGLLAKALASA